MTRTDLRGSSLSWRCTAERRSHGRTPTMTHLAPRQPSFTAPSVLIHRHSLQQFSLCEMYNDTEAALHVAPPFYPLSTSLSLHPFSPTSLSLPLSLPSLSILSLHPSSLSTLSLSPPSSLSTLSLHPLCLLGWPFHVPFSPQSK